MSIFTDVHGLIWGALGLVIGTASGFSWHAWQSRRETIRRKRIPRLWPLIPRLVINSQERMAWRWLTRVFFDHSVMIKMPVTRFTLPKTQEQGQHWYQLLTNAYSTFTLVNLEGQVVGCIDVANPLRNSKRSQILKHSLLAQCGIGYVVINSPDFPDASEIRAKFFGEIASQQRADFAKNEYKVSAASDQLRASLKRQRTTRNSDLAPLAADSSGISEYASDLNEADSHILHSWQGNSFLSPLDSRKGGLS